MVKPRKYGARVGRLRNRLSERDLAVLTILQRVRLTSLRQLQRLLVTDGSPAARTRRAQLLMTRLTELGLVTRFSRVIGGVRAGSSGFIYGLSGLGQAVLDIDAPRRRVWESKPYFQDHMLATTELYVQLVEQHRLGEGDLLAFDAEPAAWRHFTDKYNKLVMIKPDAYARVGTPTTERSTFIEVDMGTETIPTLKKKSQRYIDYWRSGVEQQFRGVFPKVTWLVKDSTRAERVTSMLRKLASDAHELFEVGLLTDGPRLLGGGQSEQTGAAA
ncbi:replication-relaxation family protein [Streptomyces cucumeris]|uniref:replication-relaxation family protein n=1 Tax=Streptomyces cucumeris TaxID=2962890 RepID=UPI003D74A6B0